MIVTMRRHKFVGSLGHTSEDETGLIYMRARWMDPSLGRFISEDPARDGANWGEYCRGNPVNAVDPDGRETNWGWLFARLFASLVVSDFFLGTFIAACSTFLLVEAALIHIPASMVGAGTANLGVAYVALSGIQLGYSLAVEMQASLTSKWTRRLGAAGGPVAAAAQVVAFINGMSVLYELMSGVMDLVDQQ